MTKLINVHVITVSPDSWCFGSGHSSGGGCDCNDWWHKCLLSPITDGANITTAFHVNIIVGTAAMFFPGNGRRVLLLIDDTGMA